MRSFILWLFLFCQSGYSAPNCKKLLEYHNNEKDKFKKVVATENVAKALTNKLRTEGFNALDVNARDTETTRKAIAALSKANAVTGKAHITLSKYQLDTSKAIDTLEISKTIAALSKAQAVVGKAYMTLSKYQLDTSKALAAFEISKAQVISNEVTNAIAAVNKAVSVLMSSYKKYISSLKTHCPKLKL
ncbi:MAG: hypothetical protein OXB86_03560 [Bdellovibrionales bacterium]|nr:hypothetical protein [Bdellovibrionales bacterium]